MGSEIDKLKVELQEAEEELNDAYSGYEFRLDLTSKMGMVVNPDGTVSKIIENGQADLGGLSIGCTIFSASDKPVNSLVELKEVIMNCKKDNILECSIYYHDPRRAAITASKVADLKAKLSSLISLAANVEAENAQREAEVQQEAARLLFEANEMARMEAEMAAAKLHEETEELRRKAQEEADIIKEQNEYARIEAERETQLQNEKKIQIENEVRLATEAKQTDLQREQERKAIEAKRAAKATKKKKQLELEKEKKKEKELEKEKEKKKKSVEESEQFDEHDDDSVLEQPATEDDETEEMTSLQETETETNKSNKMKKKDQRIGHCTIKLAIISAKNIPRDHPRGKLDLFVIAEVIDLLTNDTIEPPRRYRSMVEKHTFEPEWMESVIWKDILLPPSSLAVKVKLMDMELNKSGGFHETNPLGEVLIPIEQEEDEDSATIREQGSQLTTSSSSKSSLSILSSNQRNDQEKEIGKKLDHDLWYKLSKCPKQRKPAISSLQIRLSYNEYKKFDCQICGRHNIEKNQNKCRICDTHYKVKLNQNISVDSGDNIKLQKIWLERRKTNIRVKLPREPLVMPQDDD